MNGNEWKSIKEGDIIYSTRTKRPRTVIKFSQKSNCATLENGTVYCLGDKYLFDKHKGTKNIGLSFLVVQFGIGLMTVLVAYEIIYSLVVFLL